MVDFIPGIHISFSVFFNPCLKFNHSAFGKRYFFKTLRVTEPQVISNNLFCFRIGNAHQQDRIFTVSLIVGFLSQATEYAGEFFPNPVCFCQFLSHDFKTTNQIHAPESVTATLPK